MKYPTRDLFLLQTELIDAKVNMAATQAIDRVIDQIQSLKDEVRNDMRELRTEMNDRFSYLDKKVMMVEDRVISVENKVVSIDNRLTAVETKLGMVAANREEVKSRLLDYTFKAGWIVLVFALSYGFSISMHYLHHLPIK